MNRAGRSFVAVIEGKSGLFWDLKREPMPIAADEVECSIQESSLGPGSRHFFEAMALPNLKQTRTHALKLAGLVIDDGQTDSWMIWSLKFRYQGHSFLIDTNDHAGLSQFYVADPECSIDILLHVLDHFQTLSVLRWRVEDESNTTGHQRSSDTLIHGQRRKAGIVMLAMACVLMMMWARSHFYFDKLDFGLLIAVSQRGEISIGGNRGPVTFDLSTCGSTDVVMRLDVNGKVVETYPMRWRHPGPAMPHWLIAGPLGLLSAYLILGKPKRPLTGSPPHARILSRLEAESRGRPAADGMRVHWALAAESVGRGHAHSFYG